VPHIFAPVGDAGTRREVGSRTIHGLLLRTNNTNYGRLTAYIADHPCIPKPHKMDTSKRRSPG